MQQLAKIISVLFHPSLLPTWLVAMLLYFVENDLRMQNEAKKFILLCAFFFFTFLLPVLNVLVLKRLGYVSSLEMEDRKERTMPYTVGLIYYAGLFYLLSDSDMPLFYKALAVCGFMLVLTTLLVNMKWKISAHMTGAGGLCGTLLTYSLLHQQSLLGIIALGFVVASWIGFARLYLQKHSPAEVYTGFVSGLVISVFSLLTSCVFLINYSSR
jgi:hypothetical protein